MQKRKFDELISYFNRKVADMDIATNYKMELLGMVTALGYAHYKETEDRKKGMWNWIGFNIECTECGFMPIFDSTEPLYKFCPNCGAEMTEGEG